jgi:hypothetical protein
MARIRIDTSDIAELGTQVGMHGAIGSGAMTQDDVFALIVGIVSVVIEASP